MKRLRPSSYCFLLTIALLLATMNAIVPMGVATGQTTPLLALQTVATGLNFPLYLTTPPGDNDRLFIVEKTGNIRIIKNGTLLPIPFLNVSTLVSAGIEQGLLGLAFDPNYAMNGRFYISYTDFSGNSKIARYLVSDNPDIAQPDSDKILLTNGPSYGHYGGNIIFGPDGYLYIGLGDGGCCNDPLDNAQNLSTLFGKVLRIDVSPEGDYAIPVDNPFLDNPSARPEVWSFGLRNPWRFSFDRLTGDLYVADVGDSHREEVNISLATQGTGKGLNYGWNIMEGTICTPGVNPNCNKAGLTLPILDYDHSNSCSVTGGHVYRGLAIPEIFGTYFYADYCLGWVRSFKYQNGQAVNQMDWVSLRPGGFITSFGEDAQGELYILTQLGGVYRIITTTLQNRRPSAIGLAPSNITTGPGVVQSFTAVYSDPNGWQNIAAANFYLSGNGGQRIEWVHYLVVPNLFTMLGSNDVCSPGQVKKLSNGFLNLDCEASSVSASGTVLTVIFRVTPQAPSSGINYNIFTGVSDQASGAAYGLFTGTWRIQ